MLDAFTKVVAQADTRGESVSSSHIDALKSMVADRSNRIDGVNRITGNAPSIEVHRFPRPHSP
jgi:phycocyanin beta chain